MGSGLVQTLMERFKDKSTEELRETWVANDRTTLSDDAFTAIRRILEERGEHIPAQGLRVCVRR